MPNHTAPSEPIAYATPNATTRGARTLAASVILFAGLALVVIGGCFCIGVLITVQHTGLSGQPQPLLPMTASDWSILTVLALLAAASFAGGLVLICIGVKALLRIARG